MSAAQAQSAAGMQRTAHPVKKQGRGWGRMRERARRRRRLGFTRIGRTYVVLTVGVGFGALNTGNNLLYLLLGLLLSMIIVSGVLSERALRGITVRRLGTDAAFAQEPFAFRYAVTRTAAGTTFALHFSEEGELLTGSATAPYLRQGEEQIIRAQCTAPRRGPYRLTGVKVTTRYPLGLFSKSTILPLEDLLLVYPRRAFACGSPDESELGPVGEAGNPRHNDGSGDILGLRELGENEDARRVHWKKSATAGRLLRVEREREERRSFVLQVRPGLGADALERRCEEVGAQTQRLITLGHEVGLEADGKRLRPAAGTGQQKRILRALAQLGFGPGAAE